MPNPFFGLPAGQGKNVTSATIARRELLRPFPQFNDILMRQSTLGKSQYHAARAQVRKAHHQRLGRPHQLHLQPLEGQPVRRRQLLLAATSTEAQDAYNLDAEYSIGLLDVPHKITIAPIVELPFGEGKRWAQSGVGAAILGDWTISSIIGIESGFPISVYATTPTPPASVHPHARARTPARAKPKPTARATSASRRRRLGLHASSHAAPASG